MRAFLLICLLSIGAAAQQSETLPEFSLRTLKGHTMRSQELKDSIVVLDFWATWCEGCITEIPAFNRLEQKYGPRGVKVIGMAVSANPRRHSGQTGETRAINLTFPESCWNRCFNCSVLLKSCIGELSLLFLRASAVTNTTAIRLRPSPLVHGIVPFDASQSPSNSCFDPLLSLRPSSLHSRAKSRVKWKIYPLEFHWISVRLP